MKQMINTIEQFASYFEIEVEMVIYFLNLMKQVKTWNYKSVFKNKEMLTKDDHILILIK